MGININKVNFLAILYNYIVNLHQLIKSEMTKNYVNSSGGYDGDDNRVLQIICFGIKILFIYNLKNWGFGLEKLKQEKKD